MTLPVFTGDTVHGSTRGRKLGSPTINVQPSSVPAHLEQGVYACWVQMDDQGVLRGAMHFGARPTFGDTLTCEVHIIDKIITELPRSITIQPVAILRSIVHFETANNLVEQIQKDIASCRALLTDAPKKLQ